MSHPPGSRPDPAELSPGPGWLSDRLRWLRANRGHGTWIAVWSFVGIAGTVAAPILVHHPVVLMAMAPRAMFVVLAAPHLDLTAFVALGTVRLSVADPSYFVLGSRWSRSADGFSRRLLLPGRRLVRMLCSSAPLAGLVLFLRPSGRYLAVAGAHRVSASLASVAAVSGTVIYLVAVHQGIGVMFT